MSSQSDDLPLIVFLIFFLVAGGFFTVVDSDHENCDHSKDGVAKVATTTEVTK